MVNIEYLTTLLQRRTLFGVDKCVKMFTPMRAKRPAYLIFFDLVSRMILRCTIREGITSSCTTPLPVRPKYATECYSYLPVEENVVGRDGIVGVSWTVQ